MKKIYVAAAVLILSGCGQSPEEEKLNGLKAAQSEIEIQQNYCRSKDADALRASSEKANLDWDKTAVENLDNISPEQELSIKRALSKELGVSADQVDWKSIYRSRAENGDKKMAQIQSEIDRANKLLEDECGASKRREWQDAWIKNHREIEKLERKIAADR